MHWRTEDALVSAHEIEPNNPDVAAALKQLKKNMEDYKWRTETWLNSVWNFQSAEKIAHQTF